MVQKMNNRKFEIKLEWVNKDEFGKFLDELKETHNWITPFEARFTFKFSDGSEQRLRFLFNQENGFHIANSNE